MTTESSYLLTRTSRKLLLWLVFLRVMSGTSWYSSKEGEKGRDEEKGDGRTTERSSLTATSPTDIHALASVADDEVVHRGPVLSFFVAISALSMIAALCLGAAHAASLYAFVAQRDKESVGPVDIALRSYGFVFCLAIVIVELELGATARSSVVSRFWTLRGIFFSLVGLMALDAADDDERRRKELNDKPAWRDEYIPYVLYLRSTAIAILALGILYVAMGLCCCKNWKERLVLEHRKQLAKAQLRSAVIAELHAKASRTRGSGSKGSNRKADDDSYQYDD